MLGCPPVSADDSWKNPSADIIRNMLRPHLDLITTTGPAGYALLDSGAGRKLERFGAITVDRPEPQAMWQPALSRAAWAKAHAVFSASGEDEEKGRWRVDKPVPESWPVEVAGVTMLCKLAGLWHLGLFPEQLPHWEWMISNLPPPQEEGGSAARFSSPLAGEVARRAGGGSHEHYRRGSPPLLARPRKGEGNKAPGERERHTPRKGEGNPPRVLNLFGYTGAASLIAAKAGAEVVHVDASKKAVAWARENQTASGLGDKTVRWICEDARKFVAREIRRGRTYHSILIDPPKFGRGPDGEVWDLFIHLPALLADCARLLAPHGAHMILTAYAIRASALALDGLMRETLADRAGTLESGELAIGEQSGRRTIGTSLYSRWRSA